MTQAERALFDAFLALRFEPMHDGERRAHVAFHKGWLLDLYAQLVCGPFRLDFVLCSRIEDLEQGIESPFRVVIEVDGPEHDSRAGRRKDRERDRLLVLCGLTMVRFTNAEVLADPIGCAREVIDFVLPLQQRHFENELRKGLERRFGTAKTREGRS